jgi:hypothetical protein
VHCEMAKIMKRTTKVPILSQEVIVAPIPMPVVDGGDVNKSQRNKATLRGLLGGEVGPVIHSSVLSDRGQSRLMGGGGID